MKKPQDRETTDREEMMCTLCNTEGLEEHPAYEDEYSGRASLLKATRCTNEDCEYHKGVPRDQIEMQMPDSGLGISAILSGDLSANDILTFVFIIGGLIFVAFSFGLIPTGSNNTGEDPVTSTSQISGKVLSDDAVGKTVSLYANGTEVNSTQVGPNGTYTFSGLSEGNYTVYLLNESGYGPPGKTVQVNGDGNNTTVNFNSSGSKRSVDINQTVGSAELLVNYTNPGNINTINLNLEPVEGETVQRGNKLSTTREENIIMPVFPREQQFRVRANYTVEEFIDNKRYMGQAQSYRIRGNADAKRLTIALPDIESSDAKRRVVDVSGTTTKTIEVTSNQTLGEVRVTLKNGTSTERKQSSGVWKGQQDNFTLVTGTNGFADGQVTITPRPQKTKENFSGVINDGTITHSFRGNSRPENVSISFLGGDAQAAVTGSAELSVSAENGTTERKVKEVAKITDSGSYRIEWKSETQRNASLVNFSYEVNDRVINIDRAEGGEALELEKGDTVRVAAKAQREALGDTSSPPNTARKLNDNLKVKDVRFEPSNPSTGDVVSVTMVIKNVGNTEVSDTVQLYQNGERFSSTEVTLGIGETVELGPRDIGQPAVNKEGTHVWYVNERGPYFLNVGGAKSRYGVGNISVELKDVESQGKVSVDTNRDGKFDCTVLARGGTCEIGSVKSGQETFQVNQSGVTNTEYVIEYTSVTNPRDIKVDVGEDGLVDFTSEGILKTAESGTVQLPPNSTNVSITVGNNIPVGYSFSWESSAVINSPVVDIEGDVKVSGEGSFVEPRTYKVGTLSQGEHTFRFQAESGGYTAVIKWNEQQGASFPVVSIDNQVVCKSSDFVGGQKCVVDENIGKSPGTHTINFDNVPSDSFNYQVRQDARAVADKVTISVNGQEVARFFRPTVEPKPWEQFEQTTAFSIGENTVNVDVQEQNGIRPEVDAQLRYVLDAGTVSNLTVRVIDSNGTERVATIPETAVSNGKLVSPTSITIPKDWLSVGRNRIVFESENGVFELNGEIEMGEGGSVEFRTIN